MPNCHGRVVIIKEEAPSIFGAFGTSINDVLPILYVQVMPFEYFAMRVPG
jgi:hypothetical protein